MTWLTRWRYRGRHRGAFLDSYRSVEAFARAEELNARWCAILDADIQRDLVAAHRAQIEALLPPLDHEPTIIFDPPRPVDRSGLSLWNLEQLAADLAWPTVTLRLWLPGDEVDDDDQAQRDRLMGMAGA